MCTDISMEENPEKKLDSYSQSLKDLHKWEKYNLGYINGVNRDYGDDPADKIRREPLENWNYQINNWR